MVLKDMLDMSNIWEQIYRSTIETDGRKYEYYDQSEIKITYYLTTVATKNAYKNATVFDLQQTEQKHIQKFTETCGGNLIQPTCVSVT